MTMPDSENRADFLGTPGYWPVLDNAGLDIWGTLVEDYRKAAVGAVVWPSGEPMLVVHPPGAVVLGDWFIQTLSACRNLRWIDDDLPHSSAVCTQWPAVSRLLKLLVRILEQDCPAPSLVPSDTGGVVAEWDRNGLHLEIESDPDGAMGYYASGCGREREGTLDPLNPDDVAYLKECAKLLPGRTLVGTA